MHDHLKYAALAAAMTDDELLEAVKAIDERSDLTGEQQAILDELVQRKLTK